jgi:hypothetical protein
MISNGDGTFSSDVGKFKEGWCSHSGSYTQWADFNGDGKMDMMCDDSQGSHWSILTAVGGPQREEKREEKKEVKEYYFKQG